MWKTDCISRQPFRKKHDKDFVVERSQGGPKDKVAGASGIQIFHQELPRVRYSYSLNHLDSITSIG